MSKSLESTASQEQPMFSEVESITDDYIRTYREQQSLEFETWVAHEVLRCTVSEIRSEWYADNLPQDLEN